MSGGAGMSEVVGISRGGMSRSWVCPEGEWVCPGGGGMFGGCMTYPMMHVMLPTQSPNPPGQTDACENITFPQLPVRAWLQKRHHLYT